MGKGPANNVNGTTDVADKKCSIKISKGETKLSLRLHCNGDESYFHELKQGFGNLKCMKTYVGMSFA